MNSIKTPQKQQLKEVLSSNQKKLCNALEAVDEKACFSLKPWDHKDGGGGNMATIRGDIVEKSGVNVSFLHGKKYPEVEKEYANKPFFACGLSTITHMKNPHAPIGHMNIRLIGVENKFWVGGGADMTPCIKYKEDTEDFHESLKRCCESFKVGSYKEYSKWCDEYFYIPHRKTIRGIGGIFFDYLTGDFEELLGFLESIAATYIETYPRILARRKNLSYTDEQKEEQLYWRGKYAEFNLIYDRGTKFGLMNSGNIDAIFVSLPPVVKW
jgi:coproporphyrinogen III oxidase